jgi:starch-binding outer membrane protein, SusD/RagB family
MKIRAIYMTLGLLLVAPFSCSDWMELVPPQGLIREEFWKTKEDVQAVIMGAYQSFAGMDASLFKYGEIRADMVVGDYNVSYDEQQVAESNIYSDNWYCNWENFYEVINYCNEVIKNAPLVQDVDDTFTDFQMQGYLSEAVFLRSLAYFYLVRIFKDVPYVTEPTETDDADIYLEKMDGLELLELLRTDLEEYRKYATIDGYPTLEEMKGRATKTAIDALLADISLWLFDYEAVIKHVEHIESNIEYVLMPMDKWFELYYPGNSLESIFEFQFDNNLNQLNGMYGTTWRYNNNYFPSEKAVELLLLTKEPKRGENRSIAEYEEDEYMIWKYVGAEGNGQTSRSGMDQNSANWIVYRLADVKLMKAEALSQLGRFGEALIIINEIRDRADLQPISIPNSETAYEDAILQERSVELCFEGKRWFDLVRMGSRNNYARKGKLIEIIVQNVPSTQKRILAIKLTNPLGWYLPILEREIERNKNLVQNPYYEN